jgi:hypothetical protein
MAKGIKTGWRIAGVPNRTTVEVKRAAQEYTAKAITALVNILRNPDSPPAARIAAARELLDRGHGKAAQAIDPFPQNLPLLPPIINISFEDGGPGT